MPDHLPDDPAALKQLIAQMQSKVAHLEEQNALLRQRLFGRKSEQAADSTTPHSLFSTKPKASSNRLPRRSMKKFLRQLSVAANASRYQLIYPVSKSSTNCLSTN